MLGMALQGTILGTVAFGVVEAPPVKPDLRPQPIHPIGELVLDAFVGVVQVGCSRVGLARVVLPLAPSVVAVVVHHLSYTPTNHTKKKRRKEKKKKNVVVHGTGVNIISFT